MFQLIIAYLSYILNNAFYLFIEDCTDGNRNKSFHSCSPSIIDILHYKKKSIQS